MIELAYPDLEIPQRILAGSCQLFDPIRKKWVARTPEEWVRQQFLQLLTKGHNYPSALVAVEKAIKLGGLTKRFDILVYDQFHSPWMMVECKSSEVTLNETVLEQLLRYNISVPVPYLLITNGPFCMGWKRTEKGLISLDKIPSMEG
jgi:hypothetical protein